MESNKEKNYVLYMDLLNIAACFAVVILHVNNTVHTFSYARYWITSMVLESAFYWAVPVFLMLSGATLLDYRKRYSTKAFLKRRLGKVVPPYLFWSLVAIAWAVLYTKRETIADVNSLGKIVDNIINCRAMSIYWFFPAIIAIYFCIPVLSSVSDGQMSTGGGRLNVYKYMIACALVTVSVLPLLFDLLGIQWNSAFQITVAGGYLIFPLLGYVLANTELDPTKRKIIYLLGILGWMMYFGGTIIYSYRAGTFTSPFKGYTKLPGVMMGAGVFAFFQYHNWDSLKKDKIVRMIKKVSGLSFGVYLVHHFYIDFMVRHFALDNRSWTWRVFGPFLIYAVSVLTVMVLKKLPLFKRTVP
jgi:surface polysaccharide O-acyltransferase-like enzyme